jgi:biopolymer transport protein ExbD
MAAAHKDDGALFAEINVTPLVDITLVLLIVFMVAAPLIVATPSIKVDLPRAATADETKKSTLALTLQRDPAGGNAHLYANGKEADEGTVQKLASSLAAKDPNLQAVVAADRGIPYGAVMHIVDLVKGAGISRFALDTEAATPQGP